MSQVSFKITCPYCKQNLKCPAKLVGYERECPGCQRPFFIPIPTAIPLEQPQDDPREVGGDIVWEFNETKSAMDDSVFRTAVVSAKEEKCGLRPQLNYRAAVNRCSVMQEVFVSFPKKVFSIRDELLPAGIRIDQGALRKIPISPSETGNACFFEKETSLLNGLQGANQILVEVQVLRHGTQVFEFKVNGFGDTRCKMYAGAVEANPNQLLDFNQDLVDHIIRLGPKNIEGVVEALCKSKLLRNDQVNKARRKELVLFAAVQAFGEKYHVAEIYGAIEGSRINDPFPIAIYNNLCAETWRKIEKLVITE